MAMSRIIQTLAPRRRSAILTFSPRFFSAGSDADYSPSGSIRTYKVCVKLPREKLSKEEKDDWYHWFLASSSSRGGSKAATTPTKGDRDPRILWTYPCGFCARLSVQDLASLWKRDELLDVIPYVKQQQKIVK